ncbi:pyridoxamine 5'-phosphate oxidase family protein [Streptomyces sp. V3I7]|uniref:pyridoxamine 5'-phosphate oxidase family protein n=1 Tax=Streptomyces sp. V3I7 TaxID=3042278 RepID=UPI0027843792|nr:pyridoxamine 5'-phosphate oxidase family protein [Streptomyces sp. V3I7]MDQ0992840.1 putative pyridoxine 5'-phosphate oxidase superfamily flavin-nucleotide-binding protein [Streptomyces sp. V3I7]
MKPDDFYHEDSRRLQGTFGTERLADHIAANYVEDHLSPEHVEWIGEADEVYLATVSPDGHPECSYKGGLPGFIRVHDPRTLEIPSYDGNGMYRTLGNARSSPEVGLLFLFPGRKAKLRVNGRCELYTGPESLDGHPGAEAVLRVAIREVFENCPRYLHDRAAGTHSAHCPRPDYRPPTPDWKLKPEYEGILPRQPNDGASAPAPFGE